MHHLKYWLFALLICLSSITSANVTDHFNAIKSDPNALYTFFNEMPKGGELHYHLSGSSYPETMLALAAKGNYCIDPKTFFINQSTTPCDENSRLTLGSELYNNTVRAWSMKDFTAGQESAHDHFFSAF